MSNHPASPYRRPYTDIVVRLRDTSSHPLLPPVLRGDPGGARRSLLLSYLPAGLVAEFLDEVPPDWTPNPIPPLTYAASLWPTAVSAVLRHHEAACVRLVGQIAVAVWLAGRDDVVDDIRCAGWDQFGAPILLVTAHSIGLPVPPDRHFTRMAHHLPCVQGCTKGCEP